jgi:3-hydroxyisobutyrate dehydrogenase-like beta-hydroxyacid dehydrogenase
MCKNIVEKGDLEKPLIIFNRTNKRTFDLMQKLPSGKSTVASNIEEAVSKSDIIFTCVSDDVAINETIGSALKGNVIGKLFIDCSTVHPDTTSALAKKITGRGAEFVACPVFGGPAMADSGQLICILAGPKASAEKVKPYTNGVMGRAVIDFSGQPCEKAATLKIIGNTMILNMMESLSEANVLAEKSGLGSDNLSKYVEVMFPGPYPSSLSRMISGEYYKREEPLFSVDLARKDARHAMDLAKAFGAQIKSVEVADTHLVAVKEYMGERGDIAGIYGAVRQEAGLKFEN